MEMGAGLSPGCGGGALPGGLSGRSGRGRSLAGPLAGRRAGGLARLGRSLGGLPGVDQVAQGGGGHQEQDDQNLGGSPGAGRRAGGAWSVFLRSHGIFFFRGRVRPLKRPVLGAVGGFSSPQVLPAALNVLRLHGPGHQADQPGQDEADGQGYDVGVGELQQPHG